MLHPVQTPDLILILGCSFFLQVLALQKKRSTISTLLLQIFQAQSSHVFYRKSKKSLELLTLMLWARQQSLLTVSISPRFNCQPLGQLAPGTITEAVKSFHGAFTNSRLQKQRLAMFSNWLKSSERNRALNICRLGMKCFPGKCYSSTGWRRQDEEKIETFSTTWANIPTNFPLTSRAGFESCIFLCFRSCSLTSRAGDLHDCCIRFLLA